MVCGCLSCRSAAARAGQRPGRTIVRGTNPKGLFHADAKSSPAQPEEKQSDSLAHAQPFAEKEEGQAQGFIHVHTHADSHRDACSVPVAGRDPFARPKPDAENESRDAFA